MATYEDVLAQFKQEMESINMHYEESVYHEIVDYLGPSIHQKDSSLVACSDPDEMALIKNNFLIGKLGLEDGEHLDNALKEACHALGESNRNKHRPTFYYLLVVILKKGDVFRTGKY